MIEDKDVYGLSWYELCALIAAIRWHKKRSMRDRVRRVQKNARDGRVWSTPPYKTKIDSLKQMEATLTSFERRLARHYGFDPTAPSRVEEALKLNAEKVIELRFKEVDGAAVVDRCVEESDE